VYGVNLETSELVKLETKDSVLDHIYDHISKEFKWIIKDSPKKIIKSDGKEILEEISLGMEGDKL